MADIIIAGFGGQGVLTAGKILIDIAAHEGRKRQLDFLLRRRDAWRHRQLQRGHL